MDRVNILLVGAGGIGHGSSILKALNLSSLNLNIVAADMSPRLIHTADAATKEIIPPVSSSSYLDEIEKLVKKYSINAMFTGSEQELDFVGKNKSSFESLGIKVFLNNQETIGLCKNKFECFQFLSKNGMDIPKTILIETLDDVAKIDFSPVVIKPYKNSGASQNVFIAKDAKELSFICTYLLNRGIDIIAQEYVPFDSNEYTVGVTTTLESPTPLGSVVVKKNLEGMSRLFRDGDIVVSSGITQGEVCIDNFIQEKCEQIATVVGSTGPINIQLRVKDGKVLPFEINPRFSGTTSARAMAGYNEPEFFIKKYVLGYEDLTCLTVKKTGFFVKGLDERFIETKGY